MFSMRHNFSPGIVKHYRFSASISYPTSIFETACRTAFQWRWSEVLEVILTCFPPPRLSRAENVKLYGRLLSQTIPSIFVSSVISLTTKYILHIVLQCMFFTMACLKSTLWTICASQSFFPASVGKGLAVFIYTYIHRLRLVLQSALRGVIRQLYTNCFCLFGSFHPFYWNHHFGIQSDEICTLLTIGIAYTYRINLVDAGFRPWYLWEQEMGAKCLP